MDFSELNPGAISKPVERQETIESVRKGESLQVDVDVARAKEILRTRRGTCSGIGPPTQVSDE